MTNDKSQLTTEAERLLERMKLVPPREPGEQLRPADEARILALAAKGVSQTDIAKEVGCHQSTVSRTIAQYDDSRPLARKYLEARALDLTRRLVEGAKPETILRVLGKLDVVRDDGQDADPGSQTLMLIGSPLPDAGWRFQPDDVVVLDPGPAPNGSGQASCSLMIQRLNGPGSALMFNLPCPVSEIPPDVKFTPDAAAFVSDGEIVSDSGL